MQNPTPGTLPQPSQARLHTLRTAEHPFCVVCSQSNPLGLGLEFAVHQDGSISTSFNGHAALEGFEGCLHGGTIASLLDGAMTNCLFAHGYVAMTAELKVRYHKPVLIGPEILLQAWIRQSHAPLHLLEAELRQEDCLKAVASAKFFECNERTRHPHHPGRK